MPHVIKFPASILCLLLILSTGLRAQVADSTGIALKKPPGKAVSVFLAPGILMGASLATMEDRGFYSSYDA